jgi:hypothetical protein
MLALAESRPQQSISVSHNKLGIYSWLSQRTMLVIRILVRERNHVYLLPFVEFFSGVLRFIIVTCSLANKIKFSNRFHWNKPSLNSTCFHFKKWSFPAKKSYRNHPILILVDDNLTRVINKSPQVTFPVTFSWHKKMIRKLGFHRTSCTFDTWSESKMCLWIPEMAPSKQ